MLEYFETIGEALNSNRDFYTAATVITAAGYLFLRAGDAYVARLRQRREEMKEKSRKKPFS